MAASETVLDEQGHLLGEGEADGAGEVGSLAEVDEIFEGECEGDGFAEDNGDILLGLVDAGMLADCDGAAANVTLAGEFDAFFCCFDDD
jgi:hypothetical protein